jgi:fermentation-respiration switch protein FrsA (DUF1100 family)
MTPIAATRRLTDQHLFVVHGVADRVTPAHHAQDIYNAARNAGVDAELWIVPFADHTWEVIVAREEYERRLAEFFSEYLGA